MRSIAVVLTLLVGCTRFSPLEEQPAEDHPRADAGVVVVIEDAGDAKQLDATASDANEEDAAAAIDVMLVCAAFVDRSLPDASRALTWDFTFPTTAERCLSVRVGQSIRFTDGAGQVARFDIHSVQASGGDQPSPIDAIDLQSGNVSLPKAGTFGFLCVDHRTMRGAVRVVP
jgi:hypothetical protein